MINHPFNAKCESQRASLAVSTEIFINCRLRAKKDPKKQRTKNKKKHKKSTVNIKYINRNSLQMEHCSLFLLLPKFQKALRRGYRELKMDF